MINREPIISNPDKIFWPKEGITKGDLIEYYLDVADYILPHLKDRPESLRRFPNGIDGKSFYHKNFLTAPNWVKQEKIFEKTTKSNYLICNDTAMLAYIINLGCIDLNPWLSRIESLDKPDYIVLDLDPLDRPFSDVIKVAKTIKTLCDELGLTCFPKTSGATGMHIYIPTGAKYEFDKTRVFAEILANLVCRRLPTVASVERATAKRHQKIYIDFLQNLPGQTLASVYSVRPVQGAQVSTPLFWSEVKTGLSPGDFTLFNVRARLKKNKDIFAPVLTGTNDIEQALDKLKKLS